MVSVDVKHRVYLLPLDAGDGNSVVGPSDREGCEFCIVNYSLYNCLLWVQLVEIVVGPSDREGCEFCELFPLAVETVLAILIVKDVSSVYTITAYIAVSLGCR